jgi:hypothetical protein
LKTEKTISQTPDFQGFRTMTFTPQRKRTQVADDSGEDDWTFFARRPGIAASHPIGAALRIAP